MLRLLRIKVSLGLLAAICFFPTLLCSFALPKRRRAWWWRRVSIVLIKISLFVGGVRIRTSPAPEDLLRQNYIFASNHPSSMDGFVLQAVLGPMAVPFVAPLAQF